MSDQEKNAAAAQENGRGAATVTEDDLKKSLEALEGKPEKKVEEQTPELKTAELKKSADTVDSEASEDLKKMIDASDALSEFAGIMGIHLDSSLETLQKSVQAAAERDMTVIRVLENMNKSINALKEQVEAFGNQPGATPKASNSDGLGDEVLQKSAGASREREKVDPNVVRKKLIKGLEQHAMNMKADDPDLQSVTNAVIVLEQGGKVDQFMMQKGLTAYNKYFGDAAKAV